MPGSNNGFRILFRLLIQKPLWLAFSILLSSLAILFGVGLIGTSAYLISYAALMPSIGVLQVAIVGVRFFGLARSLFRYLERLASHTVNFNMLTRLRGTIFRRYSANFPASFFKLSSGEVLGSLVEDVETIEFFFIRVINPPLTALLVGASTSVLLYGFHTELVWQFTVCFFGSASLSFLASYALARITSSGYIQKRSDLHTILTEYVNGLPDLIVNQSETAYTAKIIRIEKAYQKAELRIALSTGISNGLILLLSHGSMLLILISAGYLVQNGLLDGKSLAACALLTLAAFDSIQPLSLASQQMVLTSQALERVILPDPIKSFQPAQSSIQHPAEKLQLIQCKQLSFQHDPDRGMCLRDISLDWHQGEWIALVGPSGAGKTTLARLLLGYWPNYTGQLEYDGCPGSRLSPEWIRAQVAYSGQSAYFMNATLRENLALASHGLSETQMMKALETCQLNLWYQSLPEGLDTPLGERGLKLSEGERRRLDLARMILRDTPFLIFDEPLSGLDSITEQALTVSLRGSLQQKSVLWITHRLSGLDIMDQILVLDQGRLVQRGKPTELTTQEGLFQRMLAIQQRIIR